MSPKNLKSGGFQCSGCGKIFDSRNALENHCLACVEENKKDEWVCIKCNSTFNNKEYLEIHEEICITF